MCGGDIPLALPHRPSGLRPPQPPQPSLTHPTPPLPTSPPPHPSLCFLIPRTLNQSQFLSVNNNRQLRQNVKSI